MGVGFLLNPILGNIFLCQYEQIWLQLCHSSFSPTPLYSKYVEDTFTCLT